MSGRTPGRRGEKRARTDQGDKDDERRRKAGKIVKPSLGISAKLVGAGVDRVEVQAENDEDIFGKRGSVPIVPSEKKDRVDSAIESKTKRPKIPQQVSDNKAVSPRRFQPE